MLSQFSKKLPRSSVITPRCSVFCFLPVRLHPQIHSSGRSSLWRWVAAAKRGRKSKGEGEENEEDEEEKKAPAKRKAGGKGKGAAKGKAGAAAKGKAKDDKKPRRKKPSAERVRLPFCFASSGYSALSCSSFCSAQ